MRSPATISLSGAVKPLIAIGGGKTHGLLQLEDIF
jgi:hypothetical protein